MSAHDEAPTIKDEDIRVAKDSVWAKLPMIGGVMGAVGLGLLFGAGGWNAESLNSYLTFYMAFLAFSLGGLFFVIINFAVRSGWNIVVRRIAENVAFTLPVMALMALPIYLGAHEIFEWTHEEVVANDTMLSAKAPYLNMGAFTGRLVIYALIWGGLGLTYWRWSVQQDESNDPAAISHKQRALAPLAIILTAFSTTFAGFDFLMSLDPHWFSTIYGVYIFAGAFVSIHAIMAVVVLLLQGSGQLRGIVTAEHFHDLGKFMFAFTVFWAYIGFSQYMLIWYASIPEETNWYSYRGHGAWLNLSLLLVFGRFVVPFLFLLSRWTKRKTPRLFFWAWWIILFEFVDMYWLVQPIYAHHNDVHGIPFGVDDIGALLGIGGIWLATFGFALSRNRLIPVKDPRLAESLAHENF